MKPKEIYEINQVSDITVTLLSTKPAIVRRLHVLSEISLLELHITIQFAMGWTDSHLFQFDRGDLIFGVRYPEIEADFPDLIDAFGVPVSGVLKRPGQTITYTYDFGDHWEHKVQLNNHIDLDSNNKYPICISGEGNCPPEDCGGIHGFYYMLEILKDTKHPEFKDIKSWVGKKYDPETFDIFKINKKMKRVKSRIKEYSLDKYMSS